MRFDVALSFARPERSLARELADSLRADGLSVFFDEDFEHEMLGRDGADYLNQVFFEESRCCVAFVSRSYQESAWAQLERRAAQARELERGPGAIIPVLVDAERPAWLLPTRIYFDLAKRPLSDLRNVLRRRLTADIGDRCQTLEDVVEFPFGKIAAGPGQLDFLAWVTASWSSEPQPLQHLRWDADSGSWLQQDLGILVRAEWLFVDAWRIVAVPRSLSEPIVIHSLHGTRGTGVALPIFDPGGRLTDCKHTPGQLLLGLAGGGVWAVDLTNKRASALREDSDGSFFCHIDYLSAEAILYGDEDGRIEVCGPRNRRPIASYTSPEPVAGVWCFPGEDRAILAGALSHLFFYRASDWTLLSSTEVGGQTLRGWSAKNLVQPALGLVAGHPFYGNCFEIYDPKTCERLVRNRSQSIRGWGPPAFSNDGTIFAAMEGEAVVFFSRM